MRGYNPTLLAFILVLSAFFSCSKTEEPTSAGIGNPTAVESAKTSESSPEKGTFAEEEMPSAEELPVAEDFREEFEKKINQENYRAELDLLEKEIAGDSEK